MEAKIAEYVLSGVFALGFAAFAFLAKSLVNRLERDLASVAKEVARLDGKLEALSRDIRENTVQSAKLGSEVSAVWRFIDNAPKRASDHNNGGEGHP